MDKCNEWKVTNGEGVLWEKDGQIVFENNITGIITPLKYCPWCGVKLDMNER